MCARSGLAAPQVGYFLAVGSDRKPRGRFDLFSGRCFCYTGLEQLGELIGQHGSAEIVSLRLVTFVSLKKRQLFLRFHALGNHPKLKASAHADYCLDNDCFVGLGGDLTDEGLIDLEGINGKLSKIAQARVARAEVVDRYLDSSRSECFENGCGVPACFISTLSVSSTSSNFGSIPVSLKIANTLSTKFSSRNWMAEMLTAIVPTGRAAAFRHARGLVEVDFLEPQTLQQTADRQGRILLGRLQNAIGQGGRLQLTLRLLTHLRFQILVGGYQQPSLTGVHSRFRAVDPSAEHLRRGKMQVNPLAIYAHVSGL